MTSKSRNGRLRQGDRLDTSHAGSGDTASIAALIPRQGLGRDACWRCGAEFARTDLAALTRCYALASREAS